MVVRWRYFSESTGGLACDEEILQMFDDHTVGALLDLLERHSDGMLLPAEVRDLGHGLRALILTPPNLRAGVICGETQDHPPLLILLPFQVVDGEIPQEVRIRAVERFRKSGRA